MFQNSLIKLLTEITSSLKMITPLQVKISYIHALLVGKTLNRVT